MQLGYRGLVEEPKDDLFAGYSGIGGHSNVAARTHVGFVNAPILGKRLLVGLEPREKFDAAKDAFSNGSGQRGDGSQDAIQAKGNGSAISLRMEVDIAGVGALGLLDKPLENLGRRLFGVRS